MHLKIDVWRDKCLYYVKSNYHNIEYNWKLWFFLFCSFFFGLFVFVKKGLFPEEWNTANSVKKFFKMLLNSGVLIVLTTYAFCFKINDFNFQSVGSSCI